MAEPTTEDSSSKSSLKRPRPVISCLECRRKKLKCSRTLPCQQCLKIGKPDSCSFQAGQIPDSRLPSDEPAEKRSRLGSSSIANGLESARPFRYAGLGASPAASRPSPLTDGIGLFEQLEQRVVYLESVAGVSGRQRDKSAGRDHEPKTPLSLRTPAPARPRQSMPSSIFPNAAAFLKDWLSLEGAPEPRARKAATDLRQLHDSLKYLHKRPVVFREQQNGSQIRRLVPSQPVCQTLIEIYFDNLEHCFRILHRPTFDRQLNDFFSGELADSSHHFLPQLVAILAISSILGIRNECVEVGSAFNGELIHTSVDFIDDYLHKLKSKDQHTVSALQTRMILLLLRWMRLDKLTDLWELSGQILRQALIMGLDSDPSQGTATYTVLEAELRRRLWTTICEEDMMISILCDMPCLIPDFDCQTPLNVNDVELEQDTPPVARSFACWTDTL